MLKNFLVLVFGIGPFIFIFIALIKSNNGNKEFEGQPIKTVATLIKKKKAYSGFQGIYQYNYKNESYKFVTGDPIMYSVLGDQYEAILDSLDPSNIKIKYHRPLIISDEHLQTTEGKIYFIGTFMGPPFIKFEYSANGKMYKRLQHVTEDMMNDYSNIANGAENKVEYLDSNPQRAVMHFQ